MEGVADAPDGPRHAAAEHPRYEEEEQREDDELDGGDERHEPVARGEDVRGRVGEDGEVVADRARVAEHPLPADRRAEERPRRDRGGIEARRLQEGLSGERHVRVARDDAVAVDEDDEAALVDVPAARVAVGALAEEPEEPLLRPADLDVAAAVREADGGVFEDLAVGGAGPVRLGHGLGAVRIEQPQELGPLLAAHLLADQPAAAGDDPARVDVVDLGDLLLGAERGDVRRGEPPGRAEPVRDLAGDRDELVVGAVREAPRDVAVVQLEKRAGVLLRAHRLALPQRRRRQAERDGDEDDQADPELGGEREHAGWFAGSDGRTGARGAPTRSSGSRRSR